MDIPHLTRIQKAQEILDAGLVFPLNCQVYAVRSMSDSTIIYRVDLSANKCECADNARGNLCKHLLAARMADRVVKRGEANPALFELGQIYTTPGAGDAMSDANTNPFELLERHSRGDWGEVCDADKRENELSVKEGFRILSAFTLGTGVKVWVITEADRSATTFLLPEEY